MLCKLRKLHKCRAVLVLSLPQLTPAPTVSVSPLPDIKDRESLVLCSTHPPGSGVAPWVPQAPVHGHGLVRFSTVSTVNALELGGAPWAPPRWQGEGCCPEASFLGDSSPGRGEECQPREGKGISVSVEATASVGWALLPPLAFGGSRHLAGSLRVTWGLGVQASSPSHSCFPLYRLDPLPD